MIEIASNLSVKAYGQLCSLDYLFSSLHKMKITRGKHFYDVLLPAPTGQEQNPKPRFSSQDKFEIRREPCTGNLDGHLRTTCLLFMVVTSSPNLTNGLAFSGGRS
jgi:hypothetical protein